MEESLHTLQQMVQLFGKNQTEVELIGITGKMALEGDRVIVPTRTGLSSFCLEDGFELMNIDTGNVGWRNGVTITESGYVYGDEFGYLHEIDRDGTISSIFLGEGKIRHAPLDTRHGLFVHLQTSQGSTMYLNGSVIANVGASPAMPLIHNNRIYAATSDEWMSLLCDEQSCTIDSIEPFSSNGELALRIIDSDVEIWAPSNTPNGGWGVFNETSLIRTETTFFDTYGTAAPGFGQGVVVLGNDAGILSVIYQIPNESSPEDSQIDIAGILHYLFILVFFVLTCSYFALHDWQKFAKIGSAFLLILAIAIVPELSVKLAEQTALEQDVEWDSSWPDEWKGTQVIVFEIDGEKHVIGGLETQNTVLNLTVLACDSLEFQMKLSNSILAPTLFRSMEVWVMVGSSPSMVIGSQWE